MLNSDRLQDVNEFSITAALIVGQTAKFMSIHTFYYYITTIITTCTMTSIQIKKCVLLDIVTFSKTFIYLFFFLPMLDQNFVMGGNEAIT